MIVRISGESSISGNTFTFKNNFIQKGRKPNLMKVGTNTIKFLRCSNPCMYECGGCTGKRERLTNFCLTWYREGIIH